MKQINCLQPSIKQCGPHRGIGQRFHAFKLVLMLAAPFVVSDASAFNWGAGLGAIGSGLQGYQDGARDAQREQQGLPPSNMERANRTGEDDAGGGYRRCSYSTMNGFKFSINVKGYSCPYSVQVNPETMQVLRQ